MAHKLNEEDMDLMLNNVLNFDGVYTAKIWALTRVQKTSMKKFEIIGVISSAWSNMFTPSMKTSYVGLTEDRIIIVTTKLINVAKVSEVHVLELSRIKNIYMSNYMLMKKGKAITIEYDDGKTYELMTCPGQYKGEFAWQGKNLETFIKRFFE